MSARLLPRQRARRLPDGRLHLQDGPIDLIVAAAGMNRAVEDAFEAATARFEGVLDELCAELPALRAPASGLRPTGSVARLMHAAVSPYAAEGVFITPMAAVAGAVADAILAAMVAAAPVTQASVNNGGDIALHLAPGAPTVVGLVDRADFADGPPRLFGRVTLTAADPVRGVATSGRGGRSFSLGIADAVTVLARTAAQADAAATVIANAVDLPDHPGIRRVAARDIQPDSDLGDRPVTRAVPALPACEVAEALASGRAVAQDLIDRGLVIGAALHLQGTTAVTGGLLAGGLLERCLPAPERDTASGLRSDARFHAGSAPPAPTMRANVVPGGHAHA